MKIKKITRVSVFVDHDNFTINYCRKHKLDEDNITAWDCLNERLLDYYRENFIKNDFEVVEHKGTFICVGTPESLHYREDRDKKHRFHELDRKTGFIVRYGEREPTYKDRRTGEVKFGRERGVDAEIICQMLMGAFLDHFDACILLSDDGDYLPVVRRVQEYFGKKVIQAGFSRSKLRNQSYAHIPLEDADAELVFPGARD